MQFSTIPYVGLIQSRSKKVSVNPNPAQTQAKPSLSFGSDSDTLSLNKETHDNAAGSPQPATPDELRSKIDTLTSQRQQLRNLPNGVPNHRAKEFQGLYNQIQAYQLQLNDLGFPRHISKVPPRFGADRPQDPNEQLRSQIDILTIQIHEIRNKRNKQKADHDQMRRLLEQKQARQAELIANGQPNYIPQDPAPPAYTPQ